MKMLEATVTGDVMGMIESYEEDESPKKGRGKPSKNAIIDPKLGVTFDFKGKPIKINMKPKTGKGLDEPVKTETNI